MVQSPFSVGLRWDRWALGETKGTSLMELFEVRFRVGQGYTCRLQRAQSRVTYFVWWHQLTCSVYHSLYATVRPIRFRIGCLLCPDNHPYPSFQGCLLSLQTGIYWYHLLQIKYVLNPPKKNYLIRIYQSLDLPPKHLTPTWSWVLGVSLAPSVLPASAEQHAPCW